jgi:phage terminase large subunit GpA-like protein
MSPQIERLTNSLYRALRPPPTITVSEWAETSRWLSPEASTRGKWRNRPFQSEPMDCLSPSHPCERVVLMFASQIAKTEIALNFLGYIIDRDPGPTLFVEPRTEDAKALSKDRVAPMLRDTPCLKGKVSEVRSRFSDNTTLHKGFEGGHVTFTGAISPSGLAMRPIRYAILDEVDRYPVSAGTEGDPVSLAIRRTDEFAWNKKILLCSTPTVAGASRIAKLWAESDQRMPEVPCPLCGAFQVLDFERLEWPESEPTKAEYRCNGCEELIPQHRKPWMLTHGRWAVTRPESDTPGFWLSQMYSTKRGWGLIAKEFLEAKKDDQTLKAFKNTVLAQLWEEKHEIKVSEQVLLNRCEPYGSVPGAVAMLTAGVDVQDNRLVVEVVGWGRDEESWSLAHLVLPGDPARPELWAQLNDALNDDYTTEDGLDLHIWAACIDTGGHHGASVYRFAKDNYARRFWAIKGRAGKYPIWPKKPGKGKDNTPLFMVGVDTAKEAFYGKLRNMEVGPGYCHFPLGRELQYFEELTAEKLYTRYRNGFAVREWRKEPGRANEALDCRVYALAALHGLYAGGFRLNQECDRMKQLLAEKAEREKLMKAGQVPAPVVRQQSRDRYIPRRDNWFSR